MIKGAVCCRLAAFAVCSFERFKQGVEFFVTVAADFEMVLYQGQYLVWGFASAQHIGELINLFITIIAANFIWAEYANGGDDFAEGFGFNSHRLFNVVYL